MARLEEQAVAVLEGARDLASTRSALYEVFRQAQDGLRVLAEPMRVAVAGEIKRGKSTLVNALIGSEGALSVADTEVDVAMATGQLETTYVLTEIVDGTPPGLRIIRRDGSFHDEELSRLRDLTVRRAAGDTSLDDVDRVVVTLRAPLLHGFRLIDTPGFNAVSGVDSARALDHLTGQEVGRAHAVIYAIANEGLGRVSRDVARQFSTGGDDSAPLTPMKALGVMPRANDHWSGLLLERVGDLDPFAVARREIDLMMRGPGRGLFHAVLPVDALLGEAAALAPDDDFAAIAELADPKVEDELLLDAFSRLPPSRMAFAAERPDLPLTAEDRQRLLSTFSSWGLWTAIGLARKGLPVSELRRELDVRSGVADLRDLVRKHFGARSGAIRVRSTLTQVLATNRSIRTRLPVGTPEHETAVRIGRDLENLATGHDDLFIQIDVLGQVYRGRVRFTPEQREDLLRLTGEQGLGAPVRLGLAEGASVGELRAAAAAAADRWAGHASALTGPARRAAEDIRRSLDSLQASVQTATAWGERAR